MLNAEQEEVTDSGSGDPASKGFRLYGHCIKSTFGDCLHGQGMTPGAHEGASRNPADRTLR